MIDKQGIIYAFRKYDYQTNATINTISDYQNVEMAYGHDSHNDIYLMGQLADTTMDDSTFLH